jgi:hypothetical protein
MEGMENYKKKRMSGLMATSIIIALPLIIAAIVLPTKKTEAIGIFSPFGGKVLSWLPLSSGCTAITTAVSAITLGVINISVEELKVGPPNGGTFGILRVNGVTIPGLTTIYSNYNYWTPGVNVIGNSINICDVCGKAKNVPGAKFICELPVISKILDFGCDAIGTACPLTNLVHKIGSSLIPASF